MSDTRDPQLVTVRQAATSLSVSVRSVWRLIASGALPIVKCGRSTRIPVAALKAFVEKGGTK